MVIYKIKYPPNTVNEHLEDISSSMQTKEEPRRTRARTYASGRSRNRRRNQPAWILLFLPSLEKRRCHGVSLGLPSIRYTLSSSPRSRFMNVMQGQKTPGYWILRWVLRGLKGFSRLFQTMLVVSQICCLNSLGFSGHIALWTPWLPELMTSYDLLQGLILTLCVAAAECFGATGRELCWNCA